MKELPIRTLQEHELLQYEYKTGYNKEKHHKNNAV